MNPKLGMYFTLACIVAAVGAYGCHSSASSSPTPTPTPVATGPDTLYVQTSNQVRIYLHAAVINGLVTANVVLPTSDASNPDVVYSPTYNVLWYPSAYPAQVQGTPAPTPIKIWSNPSGDGGMNPTLQVPYTNGQGTATYDVNHDLLYVANVNGPTIQVYANAHAMTSSSVAASNITLTITDPGVGGTPRPAEMVYDPVKDRLFVSDQGTVVASFDGFGTAAEAAVIGATNPTIGASRELTGLLQPYGMAYSAGNDILYVAEKRSSTPGDVVVVHNASTASGTVAHSQEITNFQAGPGGLTYDGTRDLLFMYDGAVIWVIPAPEVANGNVSAIVNRRTIQDDAVVLSGFGLSVDTTH